MKISIDAIELPSLRNEIRIYKGPDEADGSPSWTLYDTTCNRFFRIGWLEFECLSRLNRYNLPGQIAKAVSDETPLFVEEEDVKNIIDFLISNELVSRTGKGSSAHFEDISNKKKQKNVLTAFQNHLFFMIPLFKPEKFLKRTLPLAKPFLTKPFFLSMMALLLFGISLTFGRIDEFLNTFLYFFSWQGIVFYALTIIFVKIFHELAHAYTATLHGVRVTIMGIALMVGYPVMFTETTGAWRITDKKERLLIGISGVMAELCLAAVALILWHLLPDGIIRSACFFIATISIAGSLLVNLNPFMRFDGYFILSDLWGMDNLQNRAFTLAKWNLRRFLFGWNTHQPENHAPGKQKLLLFYAYGTWIYRIFLFSGIAFVLYHIFFPPIGLILMCSALIIFLGIPIAKEVLFWFKGSEDMKPNTATLRTSFIIFALLGTLFIPWQSHLNIPATMQSGIHSRIYAPVPAQITEIMKVQGDYVSSGTVMATLESPDLDFAISVAEKDLQKLLSQKNSAARNEILIQSQKIVDQKIEKKRAYLSALEDQKSRLTITAPFDGIIAEETLHLHKGRWVGSDELLFQIVDTKNIKLFGYFEEQQMNRIKKDAMGVFYPDTDMLRPYEVAIDDIDYNNATSIERPELASTFGGPIAVDAETRSGQGLKPHESVYKISFFPVSPPAQSDHPYLIKGTVRISAQSKSLVKSMWESIAALAIRELNL